MCQFLFTSCFLIFILPLSKLEWKSKEVQQPLGYIDCIFFRYFDHNFSIQSQLGSFQFCSKEDSISNNFYITFFLIFVTSRNKIFLKIESLYSSSSQPWIPLPTQSAGCFFGSIISKNDLPLNLLERVLLRQHISKIPVSPSFPAKTTPSP